MTNKKYRRANSGLDVPVEFGGLGCTRMANRKLKGWLVWASLQILREKAFRGLRMEISEYFYGFLHFQKKKIIYIYKIKTKTKQIINFFIRPLGCYIICCYCIFYYADGFSFYFFSLIFNFKKNPFLFIFSFFPTLLTMLFFKLCCIWKIILLILYFINFYDIILFKYYF